MRGRVVFWSNNGSKPGGFGFIMPDGIGPDEREKNYWFGPKALNGRVVKARDKVEFEAGDYQPGKGPVAARVWLADEREEVETLPGADEV
jgi:cold shock CspA family protein